MKVHRSLPQKSTHTEISYTAIKTSCLTHTNCQTHVFMAITVEHLKQQAAVLLLQLQLRRMLTAAAFWASLSLARSFLTLFFLDLVAGTPKGSHAANFAAAESTAAEHVSAAALRTAACMFLSGTAASKTSPAAADAAKAKNSASSTCKVRALLTQLVLVLGFS